MTEYEERVQQATAAVSEGELEPIFSDLPKLEAFRELKMQQRAQQAQWKFERKQRTHQLTSSAMKFAQKRLNGTGQ